MRTRLLELLEEEIRANERLQDDRIRTQFRTAVVQRAALVEPREHRTETHNHLLCTPTHTLRTQSNTHTHIPRTQSQR